MPLLMPLVLSTLLFCIGVYGVLARRNAILVLMAVELMLNAVNLNLVAFDVWLRDALHGGPGASRCSSSPSPPPRSGSAWRSCCSSSATGETTQLDELRRAARSRRGAGAVTPVYVALLAPALAAVLGLLGGGSGRGSSCRSRSPAPAVALGAAVALAVRAVDRGPALLERASWRRRAPASADRCRTGRLVLGLDLRVDGLAALVLGGGHGGRAAPCRSTRRRTSRATRATVVRRARLAVHRGDAARRLRRRPVRAAGRLGGHGRLLLLPDRPPLGAAEAPGPARSRRSSSPGSATSASCSASSCSATAAGTFRISGDRRGALPGACRTGTLTAATLLLLVRRGRQVGAVPAAHLAAGRDGRPDPDQRADPRGDDGGRRHLPRRPAVRRVPASRRRRWPCWR